MKYAIVLWPHANARYQQALRPLSMAELYLLLGDQGLVGEPSFVDICDTQALQFESELALDALIGKVSRSAHLLLLSELRDDGSLLPICSQLPARLGADLSGILKYKGKTNEIFTRFVLNMAIAASAFADKADQQLKIFDPMCGRGTTLFEAINRGYDAYGSDVDKADIKEASSFFKKYLEYHKIKHQLAELSMTVAGQKPLPRKKFTFSADAQAYKSGNAQELSLILGDAQTAAKAFSEKYFHSIVIDLPYGVQHAPGGGKVEALEKLMARILPALRSRLKVGGTIALSFNASSLPKAKLASLLEAAHFDVMQGRGYDNLAHWVEQAVTRDVVIGRRS